MSKFPVFRTAYDDRQKSFSDATATDFTHDPLDVDHPSYDRAVQADARHTDMNFIMERYLNTGVVPQSRVMPFYGDASAAPDLMTAMNIVCEANEAFEALPAHVRDYFDNSPEKFLRFMGDEDNHSKAVKLGLIDPDKIPAPEKAPEKAPEGPSD